MMTAHGTTLASAKAELENKELHFRASDFLSEDEQEQLAIANAKGKEAAKPYDEIDAFAAEILARFGWQTYQAWQNGEIDTAKMLRYTAAERARETSRLIPIEAIVLLAMSGANHPGKNGKPPKSLAKAHQLQKNEIKKGQGI